jgi:hypothetical protein
MVSLFAHTGLVDIILLSGAIVRLTSRYGGALGIFSYASHLESVRSFFAVYPKIRIAVVDKRFKGPYGIPPENALRAVDGNQ